jgi:hypothetical protein
MGFITSCFCSAVNPANPTTKETAHNIYVTKLVEPKVVHRVGCSHKVAFAELLVGLRGSDVKFVQDPLLDETLVSCGLLPDQEVRGYSRRKMKTNLRSRLGSERLVKFQHGEFSRVEDLVAKLAIAFHTQDFEVDITPWNLLSTIARGAIQSQITSATVSTKCETQRIGPALWNALREILLLT